MQLKEIIVVTWTLTMRLLRAIWRDWKRVAGEGKTGIGSMIMSGMDRNSGIDGAISIRPDNVGHPMSCTGEISLDGGLKVLTHTTGYLSGISNEDQRISSTLKQGDIWYVTYPPSSIYDINLIFTTWGVDVKKTKQFLPEK